MNKKIITIIILLILSVVGGLFLIGRTEQEENTGIKDEFENTVQKFQNKEEYEFPSVTSTEQMEKEKEDVSVHDNIVDNSISNSKNNSSNASGEEDKSSSTGEFEESDGKTEAEDEDTDIVGSDDKTEIELPFVPAN